MLVQAYPRDLATLVRTRSDDLPSFDVLERLLSTCYQASLLHEEGRPVTFRLALGESELFRAAEGPPAGLHRLIFSTARPLDPHELRRLAPAANFHRSLVAARLNGVDALEIWGLVHSGPRWLQSARGGRTIQQYIPLIPIIAVTGPGRVLVGQGTKTLGALAGGSLEAQTMDVFAAPWFSAAFSDFRDAEWISHATAREHGGAHWGELDPSLGPFLAQHVVRRIVAKIRESHHGGTLIFLPSQCVHDALKGNESLKLKYKFADEEPRRRILSITVRIMNELARLHAAAGPVGWVEYETSHAPELALLDEELYEVAHLVAALANVDGAVLMTTRLELLGFGGEISGSLSEVSSVERALDIGGTECVSELTERGGTRHRSAYRLSEHAHDALIAVISHDGGVRFVRHVHDRVTCWDQIATGPWEV